MIPDLPPPTIVRDARGLERLIEDLVSHDEIAVDTEADSFFSYREKVCLIQVTVEDRDYLIDPLAGLDIAPFGAVLADGSKTKIFHDGEYDVLIMKRAYGFEFAGLFDTRVAASALGSQNPGLASVLKEHFGLQLDKSMQRSNWSSRPLSDKQVRYAQLDTHYLVELMARQRSELERAGRAPVVEGECRRLEGIEPPLAGFNPDEFVRVKGVRTLSKQGQQNLRALYALRDTLAERSDLPPFKVLGNPALLALAEAPPDNLRDLGRFGGLSPRFVRRHGEDLLEALGRARELGPLPRLPTSRKADEPVLDELEQELHERLKRWRKQRAEKEGFDAALILNRHVLLRVAQEKPTDATALAGIDGICDWQLELFGDELTGVLRSSLEEIERDGLPERRGRGSRRKPRR